MNGRETLEATVLVGGGGDQGSVVGGFDCVAVLGNWKE